MKTRLATGALCSLLALPLPALAAGNTSTYTDISGKDCQTIELKEEPASSHLRCPGVAGYALDLYDDDNRMSLDVVAPDGKSSALDYWQTITWGFSSLGEKAEWRLGPNGQPLALIVRVNASENAEDSSKITSYLAVAKITAAATCVVAKIPPSAKANEEARKAADSAAGRACIESY